MANGCLDLQSSRKNIFHDIYKKANSDKCLPPPFPYFIDVELTNKCNLSCNFCSRQFMQREQGFMDKETFSLIINDISDKKTPIRFIRWGEPFLHPDIIHYARAIVEKGIPLHITTNGLLLNKEICEQLVEIGVDSIIFSMQGLTKTDYEKERNNNKYFELLENIRLLRKIRGKKEKPYITISVTSNTMDGIEEFKEFWNPFVDDIQIGVTNYSRINGSKEKHIICKEPWQKLSIDWDGEVSACCGDFDRLMNIGDIHTSSLHDLWNNEILEAYRTLIKQGKHDSLTLCSKCYPAHGDIWKS